MPLIILIFIIIVNSIFMLKYSKLLKNSYERAFNIKNVELVNVQKNGADPKGEKDSTESFQSSIDALGDSGGIVYIPAGTYIISQLKISSYVQLIGEGKSTVLKMKKNNNKPLLVLKTDTTQMVQIKNFMIDGNKKNQTSSNARGIEFINTLSAEKIKKKSLKAEHDARHLIENIYISETKGDGFYIEGRGESQIKNLQTIRSDGVGIFSNAQDNWFTDCSSGDSGLQGIIIAQNATNSRYMNCKSWFSGRLDSNQGEGIIIKANRVGLTGCEAQDNSKHGFVFNAQDIVGTGLLSEANGWQYSTKVRKDDGTGFVLYGAKNNNIQGVSTDRFEATQEGSHQTFAIQFLNGARGNSISITSRNMRKETVPMKQLNNNNSFQIVQTDSEGKVSIINNSSLNN